MSVTIEHAGLGSAYLRSHPDVPIAHDGDEPCAYCSRNALRDALAAALAKATRGVYDPKWAYRDACAILADPAFRAALTEAIAEGLRWADGDGGWMFLASDEDALAAAIVARLVELGHDDGVIRPIEHIEAQCASPQRDCTCGCAICENHDSERRFGEAMRGIHRA